MTKRHAALCRVRWFIFVLVVLALMVSIVWLLSEAVDEVRHWDGIDYDEGLVWIAGFLIPAFVVWLFQRRVARWLVPLPRFECPQCGYALRQLTTARCPECGIDFALSDAERDQARDSRGGAHE